jgi:hypothetical protein
MRLHPDFFRDGTMASKGSWHWRMPRNCGKNSAEQPRAGNVSLGMRVN